MVENYQQILKMSAVISTNGPEGREINALAVKAVECIRINPRNRLCWKVQEDYYI